jgi:hypothetical protein
VVPAVKDKLHLSVLCPLKAGQPHGLSGVVRVLSA